MDGWAGTIVVSLLLAIPGWKIFKQTGMSPAWSLLVFVPGLGILIVYVMLAFARWPALEAQVPAPPTNETS